ncbi:MAG: efflux RND transporter periplasmic adaptor subunit [Pseudomonadota bacterium]
MSDPNSASRMRRAMGLFGRITTTAMTAALAAGLVALGAGGIATRASETPPPDAAPLPVVAAAPLVLAEGYAVERSFIGQIEPGRRLEVAFETGGTLEEIFPDEGQHVEQGSVLARLDTRALDAERRANLAARDALAAQLDLAMRTAERIEGLGASGFASDQRLDEVQLFVTELQARMIEIEAVIDAIDINLDKAVLRAPFSGEISARRADPGQTVAAGSGIMTLLEDGTPELHVGLPATLAATIDLETTFTAEVLGQHLAATLEQVRPDLDPVTRTQTLIFQLHGAPELPVGQTGRIALRQSVPDPGSWVPLTALRAGPNDTWTILTVENGTVASTGVEVLHASDADAFVRGAFSADTFLVAEGGHRLVPGEIVTLAE